MKFCPYCSNELYKKVKDGSERYICPSEKCGFINWNNPTPVAAELVRLDDKYILARNSQWPEGIYSVITGFVEKGEIPEETISRELKEELGCLCKKSEFIGHFKFLAMNQLIIAYHVEAEGVINLSDEIAEIKLVSCSELQSYDFGKLVLIQEIVNSWFSKGKNA